MRRLIVCGLVAAATAIAAPAAFGSSYIVLYQQQAISGNAATTMEKAGGTLVYAYPQIGVAIASSSNPSFRGNMLKSSGIANVSSEAGFATQVDGIESATDSSSSDAGPSPGGLPNSPATDTDSLSPLQWDMAQIHTGGPCDHRRQPVRPRR